MPTKNFGRKEEVFMSYFPFISKNNTASFIRYVDQGGSLTCILFRA